MMSNIAEGFGRAGRVEFHRFVTIASGSCFELLSQVYLATDIGYIHPQEFERLRAMIEEVSKILRALRTSLEKQLTHPSA
jgi:four helix bundle protein